MQKYGFLGAFFRYYLQYFLNLIGLAKKDFYFYQGIPVFDNIFYCIIIMQVISIIM